MENASKALLIAGAILLSILIIGVGIAVFTSTQGTIDSSMTAIDEQEANAFNAKFTSYQGEQISGSNIKALLNTLASNYGTYKDEKTKIPKVTANAFKDSKGNNISSLTAADASSTDNTSVSYTNAIGQIRNSVVNKHTYKVEMSFGDNGLINNIIITDVTQ